MIVECVNVGYDICACMWCALYCFICCVPLGVVICGRILYICARILHFYFHSMNNGTFFVYFVLMMVWMRMFVFNICKCK